MSHSEDTMDSLERRRLELEDNILKLQQSLYHWRIWEAEYDGLKEEIADLPDDATTDDFLQTGRDFGGSLVTEDEVKALVTGSGPKPTGQGVTRARSKQQVVDLISRRIDYVRQNVTTMEKRITAAEEELRSLETGGVRTEGQPQSKGKELPVTEIFEEIDDDGRVISSSTSVPGEQAPQLLQMLEKAGVKDIPDRPTTEEEREVKAVNTSEPEPVPEKAESNVQSTGVQERTNTQEISQSSTSGANASQPDGVSRNNDGERPSEPLAAVPNDAHDEEPVTEVDESPEDAKLRREMLQYSINEVGAVVAELELDEDGSDITIEDYEDDSYAFESEEEEDEHGRTTRRVLTDDYHQQMRELEMKLNARGMLNVGKEIKDLPEDVRHDLERPHVPAVEKSADPSSEPSVYEKKSKKKTVAFAQELDIAPSSTPSAPAPVKEPKKSVPVRQSNIPVVSDSIIERTDQPEAKLNDAGSSTGPKRKSRFKSTRQAESEPANTEKLSATTPSTVSNIASTPSRSMVDSRDESKTPSTLPIFPAKPAEPKPFSQPIIDKTTETTRATHPTPQPPAGRTLADELVERDVPKGSALPPESDDLDEILHRKEIATEYYRLRNHMIQQNGGFVNDDDEPDGVPIEDETAEGGPPKRISKFKAARMR